LALLRALRGNGNDLEQATAWFSRCLQKVAECKLDEVVVDMTSALDQAGTLTPLDDMLPYDHAPDELRQELRALLRKVALEPSQVSDLQVQLAGKTNSAFVFIKPHACKGKPGAVEKVVEDKFKSVGIRVTGKGEILAEDIDKNLLIDNHYGAIAKKAMKLTPAELNVPDKGKAAFEKVR